MMLSPTDLARAFARNASYLARTVEGIDQEASLLQAPASVNCVNWTVGHVVHYRNLTLDLLGVPPVGGSEELIRYERESEPITGDGPGVVGFARLMALVGESQPAIESGLEAASEETLAEVLRIGERNATRTARVFFYYFHDTLHVGQVDVLAELTRRI